VLPRNLACYTAFGVHTSKLVSLPLLTQSVVKLLTRIVAPSEVDVGHNKGLTLHDHTYGITSDPLTQFACILAAIIHDVAHPGVPNTQLVQEEAELAKFYKGKSVAEQNSLDLSWELLMRDDYKDLRSTIFTTKDGLHRFRSLLVNSVMSTDIVDKELKQLRNSRWDKAFSESCDQDVHPSLTVNRKATIVIEHLIQASDVAHTMQHWHVYRKWNERFFMECYQAYLDGRAETDPTENWYRGEIDFFDFYIIPLSKKLKGMFSTISTGPIICNIFGTCGSCSPHSLPSFRRANMHIYLTFTFRNDARMWCVRCFE
jgi:3'5'-cyclic nucleotide phosphodiesterase